MFLCCNAGGRTARKLLVISHCSSSIVGRNDQPVLPAGPVCSSTHLRLSSIWSPVRCPRRLCQWGWTPPRLPSTRSQLSPVPNPPLLVPFLQRDSECATIWKADLTLEQSGGSPSLERDTVSQTQSPRPPSTYRLTAGGHFSKSRLESNQHRKSNSLERSPLLPHHVLRYPRSRCNRYEN